MRKQDIQPGLVYAYRQHPIADVRPIVFLAPPDKRHLYYRTIQPGHAFRRALEAARPTVGGAGYPAALGYSDTDLDWLRSITLADFERATSPLGRDVEYVLVHNMRRVIGPWEEADHAER